jgi:hypothetical protein
MIIFSLNTKTKKAAQNIKTAANNNNYNSKQTI